MEFITLLTLSLLLSLLFSLEAHAQMALPSIFPDMKATNPGLISLRKAGDISVGLQRDEVKKNQDVKTIDGKPFVYNDYSKIELRNVNFLYGGKGGGYTSEIVFDTTTGKKSTSVTDSSNKLSNYSSKTSSSYFEYSFGLASKWGFSLIFADYESDMISAGSVNGVAFDNNKSMTSKVTGGRIGRVYGSQNLSMGLHIEVDSVSRKSNLPVVSSVQKVMGIGIAVGGDNTHIELGLEFNPFEKGKKPNGEKTSMPMKTSFIFETKIRKVSLGYKATCYTGSYIDIDELVQSQLIYAYQNKSTRLEHTFNFSLTSDRGTSLGLMGMFSNSSAAESSALFMSKEGHHTKTKAVSIMTRIGYSW